MNMAAVPMMPAKDMLKQLSSFTQDLDSVSKIYFGLNTNGGDEYCGQVILTSMDELKWDAAPDDYKVVFIAGNEDFLQGTVLYTSACTKAKEKGVIVNTIYCGDRMQGIKEHWNLAVNAAMAVSPISTRMQKKSKSPHHMIPH